MNSPSKTVWGKIALGVLLIAGIDIWVASQHLPRELELDLRASTAPFLFRVYFDTGKGFREAESAVKPVAAGEGLQRLAFPLPKQPVRALRLDLSANGGTVVIAAASIVTKVLPRPSYRGRWEDLRLDLHRITPLREVMRLSFQPDRDFLEIFTAAGSSDPQCLLPLDSPPTGWRHAAWEGIAGFGPLNLMLAVFYALAGTAGGWINPSWMALSQARGTVSLPFRRPLFFGWVSVAALLVFYVWLLLLNQGRIASAPWQEQSWIAVVTHAIAHRWQFGPEIIMTYGPTMPLTLCTFAGGIDTAVFVGRLLFKAWSVGLLLWLGGRLSLGRRLVFWLSCLIFLGVFCEQALWCICLVAAGLFLLQRSRLIRWLLVPMLAYVAAVSLIKATFLLYAVLMLAAVGAVHGWRKRWLAALAPIVAFAVCFLLEWRALGQELTNLPVYLQGSFEITEGYSQAMSLLPEPVILILGLAMASLAAIQLTLLLFSGGKPRWASLPLTGLLAGGLLLAWKGGFVRADLHVIDWVAYAAVSAAAAPAFFPPGRSIHRRLDWACLALILAAGGYSIVRLNLTAGVEVALQFREVWRSSLQELLHPRETARAERQAVLQNRRAYALPRTRNLIGRKTVDVFCDEQAIAILNGLNYRPRPCYLNYATYTPWLMNLNLAFYRSDRAPEYVLFKLESIDNRLPTLQSGPLLVLLAERYEPVLTEDGYTVLHRRETPGQPAASPAWREGDFALGEDLALPTGDALWCDLELSETAAGKFLRTFYQQPPLNLSVTRAGGRVSEYRLVPALASVGFLLSPLPADGEEFMRWTTGQPLEAVRSIRVVNSAGINTAFQPRIHYRLRQVTTALP